MPKFKGDSDDWLDDDSGSGRSRMPKQKKNKSHASALAENEANATVSEVFPKQCRALLDAPLAEKRELLCSYRRAEVFGHSGTEYRERSPVAVGDRVKVEPSGDTGIIVGVCRRLNSLSRPAPGRDEGQVHVLAANVDLLVIVASVTRPEFTPGLVDRYLVAAQAAGILAVLCINKIDLAAEGTEDRWAIYRELGIPIHTVSAKFKAGDLKGLREELVGKTVIFSGQSGVGKTTLFRALLGLDVGAVAEISEATGKGMHTTTSAILYPAPDGSRWIDTPGVREFGLLGLDPDRLPELFPELGKISCAAAGCTHRDEEGCAARSLPRYASYRRILDSLHAGEH